MSTSSRHPGRTEQRPRGVLSRVPRPYVRRAKPSGALVCADCGLVQHRGRWYRGKPPLAERRAGLCPACQRIRARDPAGILWLPPSFLDDEGELVRQLRNIERAERNEHPLERLIEMRQSGGRIVVTTTGAHLARRIAHHLTKRFHSRPRYHPEDDAARLRVEWESPERT